MKARLMLACMTIILAAPASSAAQTMSTEVTLNVPVNLTQLGPDVAKVRVACSIASSAIITASDKAEKLQEVPVSGGQVVTTMSLVFSFTGLDNPVGKSATVACAITGFSTSQQTWDPFTQNATNPSFRTTPSITFIQTGFVW
jgi:hypothetical protein